jgi:integrase
MATNRPAGQPFRKPDGRWTVRYYDRTGKRREVSAQTVEAVIAKRDLALEGRDGKETLGAYLDWFTTVHLERRVRAGKITRRTADGYASQYARHVGPELRSLRLADVGVEDIEEWLDELECARSPRTKQPWSRRSIQYAHAALRLAFAQAVRTGRIDRNPCEHVAAPTPRRKGKAVLQPSQVAAFVNTCRSERLGSMLVVQLALGLRPGEAAAVPVTAFDPDAGTLAVRRSLGRIRGQWVWGPTKTHAEAVYELPAFALDAVARRLEEREMERAAADFAWSEADMVDEDGQPVTVPLLWCREDGQPIASNAAGRTLDRVCEVAKLPRLTPHQLRHSAASLVIAEGHGLEVASKMLRHTRLSVTSDLYVHLVDDVQRGHATALEGLARGGTGGETGGADDEAPRPSGEESGR